ncbi:WD40 repeat domain-containing protein [Chloropicon primus]|uniref:WD40 repeat domain-containing protein n=1 Tax=Chloropicon primus TaxID=1764295 RepID=A0A5B8MMU6_9CHLO|nr:WD40 repeat domain-containing protein [Chloropicon primus]UPR01053.1 WD40 repeat domain-containing protein [Chloropicon primus]|mmetsp:Transcript_8426/g.24085  ORF Transcript_8426/g.24085 Transcript_8426/m.24085 type:complete len:330 (-) Transcript_8426:1202-2191(-)|eukprot:QDZ21833.1 WD40 repeat domain-containing protein [Chloropicon primus]
MPSPYTQTEEAEFIRPAGSYIQPTTIQHWQLRDLVSSSENSSSEVYCVNGEKVVLYDTATSHSRVVQQLNYQPTSMTVAHGFLATGGTKSELDVFSLTEGTTICKNYVGGNVNNALHIGKDSSGELRLFLSNNDKTVKVFSLPSMTVIATLTFPVAINYASLSPDGNFLVAVGDSNQTYLYSAGQSSGYQRIRTFSEASDSGMCCAWNSSGMCFASASQDGSVCVWDLRSTKVLAKLQTQDKTACRVVKFSSGLTDLMAFSEHYSKFHVVDARTFAYEQVVNAGGADRDISGLCFTPNGSKVYLAIGDSLQSYDVDQTSRRSFPDGNII